MSDRFLSKSKSPKFAHYFEYAGFRVVTAIINIIPLGMASFLMGAIWQLLARFNKRHNKVLTHLRAAFPERDEQWIVDTAFKHWNNLGRTFAEGLCIQKLLKRTDKVKLVSNGLMDSIASDQRGAVLVSLHMGNWEVLAIPALQTGLSMAGIYQRPTNPFVDAYIRRIREPLYPGGLHAKSKKTVNDVIQWVRGGDTVCMMGDLRHPRGLMVPFFNAPAPSNPFPALLADKLQVPLIVARSQRVGGVTFRVDAVEIMPSECTDHDKRIEQTTAKIHAQFEVWIRETPHQWMWGHRRR
ncbi:MAG: lauroyl acyltransferase [Hyphomicrobiales bacterium]